MLGAFIKTEGQAQGLSIMLGMVMALLSGCWYPLEFFPDAAQKAAQVLPTYWAMRGLSDILARGWAGWRGFASGRVAGFFGDLSVCWRVAVSGRVGVVCIDGQENRI